MSIAMQFNSVKGKDFTSGAKAVANESDQIFKDSLESAPDFTKISKTAIASRSTERQANEKAQGLRKAASIQADRLVDVTKIRAESSKDVAAAKRPAQRMAGVVAGLGALSGYAIMSKNAKEDKEANARMEALYEARTAKITESIKASNTEPFVPGTYEGTPYKPLDPSAPTQTTPPSSSTSPTSSAPISGTTVSQAQMKQLLLDQGMDDHNATIGAAVGMGESSGRSGVLNSKGEHSLGLWQHNRDTGEDRRSLYGISDWSELSDPVTNARATYRLWKRAGGTWGDWGAYTNGSYKKFL